LDSKLNGRKFDFQLLQLILGWVTIFRRANQLSIPPSHPGQLSSLPSAAWEMSSSQSTVKLCSWGLNAGMARST